MDRNRLSLQAWLWTLGAIALMVAARHVPLAFLDTSPLARLPGSPWMELLFPSGTPTSIAALSLSSLVVVRGALALFGDREQPSPRQELIATLVFILLSSIQALGLARYLTTVQLGDRFLVDPAATFFVPLTTLTLTAGAGLLWLLSRTISRRGIGHGPLVLLAFNAASLQLLELVTGSIPLDDWPHVLAALLPYIVVLLALSRFTLPDAPPRLVLPMGGSITSPMDLVLAPLLLANLDGAPIRALQLTLAALGKPMHFLPSEPLVLQVLGVLSALGLFTF
ncbi:MAG: hypothetical protein JST92_24525, partial [Deltaproteobacteria bacterium]|nr:hypothetical protein [Deltaproteobacteria bacterium]